MALIPVVAIKVFPYAGKRKAQGDRFDVSPQDAKILKALGFVKDAPALKPPDLPKPAPLPQPSAPVRTSPAAPAPLETKRESPESVESPKPRTYRRRDLTAEGE